MRCPQCNMAMIVRFNKWRCPQGHAAIPASPEDIQQKEQTTPIQQRVPHSELRVIIKQEVVEATRAFAREHHMSEYDVVELALRLYLQMSQERKGEL